MDDDAVDYRIVCSWHELADYFPLTFVTSVTDIETNCCLYPSGHTRPIFIGQSACAPRPPVLLLKTR